MKIIGGKRDYFDYLVGYYGYDEHLAWDRRNAKPITCKWKDRFLFHICGETIPVIKKGNHPFIFDPESPLLTNSWEDAYAREWMLKWRGRKSKLNAKFRQPVLCVTDWYGCDPKEEEPFIPCLADFGFGGHIEAHEMYERIYAFLGWLKDNPAPPDNQTNKEKIVAHGFDAKRSFRPQIKS
jgi:hypothetical protein